ncbi:hypothetical protein I4F81_006050 [Pyropia yezoensis]|uniref:Uncharacterized protein n=1 Tax=Pyropia yezoensis TaxID=2788 RepID=A0ACC3C0G8_PYRYE|nr:hypothetical protein I4F81_006050 [Neopyropia yezoensis]
MDLCGPLPVTSMGGANYVLGILDDTSGYAAAIPVRLKSQAGAAAAVTVKRWEAAVGRLAKMYRTDRGGEFVNRVEAEYDWAAVNDNDSDEGGAPSGNLAPNSAAGVADVTDQALPADEDAASDADPADGALVTADVDGTSSEAAELEMSTLLDAARRASGLPTPPNLLEMGTAVPDDSPGAVGETIVSVDASLTHARYPGRARTAPQQRH